MLDGSTWFRRLGCTGFTLALAVFDVLPAQAEPGTGGRSAEKATAAEKALAETLFLEGKNLMVEGRHAEGCTKLEQSQAIEAAVGTMLYLAECYENTGRLASAWAMFREASSRARAEGQPDRAQAGAERARSLEPKLSRITVNMAKEHQVPELRLRLDGNVLPMSLLGSALPVDGGNHTLEAEAPGHQPFSIQLSVTDPAGAVAVQVPALTPLQRSTPEPEPTPAPAAAAPTSVADSEPQPEGDDTRALVGLALGGVGLVGIGVGGYFGLKAADDDDEAEAICPRLDPCEDQRGLDLTERAQSKALVANVLYGVGGAALVAGVILYLTAEDGDAASASRPAIEVGRARIRPDVSWSPSFSGVSVNTEF